VACLGGDQSPGSAFLSMAVHQALNPGPCFVQSTETCCLVLSARRLATWQKHKEAQGMGPCIRCKAHDPARVLFRASNWGKMEGTSSPSRGGEEKRKSGREDLNLRPHGPEPCALTELRYAPNETIICASLQLGKKTGTSV
jgi:hypothetical protein